MTFFPFKSLFYLFALSLFFLTSACASTAGKRSMGEVIDDSVISNKLKVKYLKDKTVKGFKINVDTWKGVVSLRGVVSDPSQIARAIEIAELQPGVHQVKSYLVVGEKKPKKEKKESKHRQDVEEVDLASPKPQKKEPKKPAPSQSSPVYRDYSKPVDAEELDRDSEVGQ